MQPILPLIPAPKLRTVLLTATAAVLLAVAIAGYLLFFGPNDFPDGGGKTFYVSRGQSFTEIVDSLQAQGIIRNRGFFTTVARVYGGTSRLQVGKYNFESGVSNSKVYLTLRDGIGNLPVLVTIPEGSRPRTVARIFARQMGTDSARFMQLVHDPAFAQQLGIDARSLEGYLLPETYALRWGQTEEDLVRELVDAFQEFFTDSLKERAQELGWTVHQAVTFASIVEGEAILDEERPIIAGVYHNRLRLGMRLEADPTIQFLFGDGPRRVLYSDLRMDSPYNTYRYAGLPPGPVNNPGKRSILASLYPATHGLLFFVANGSGGHWFSSSYAEHLQNVRKYRRERARQWREAKGPTGG